MNDKVAFCPRVAFYLRVSTSDQNLDGQRRDLLAYASTKGWVVVAEYAEKVSARGLVLREAYTRLLTDARHPIRRFDRVLVWSLDRWSRDPSFVKAVGSIEELEAIGVKFHSLREPMLDSSEDRTPSMERQLLRAVTPVISAFESRRKSERVLVAMREIREGRRPTRSGRPVGRPVRVTPEVEAEVRRLREMGLKWKDVARRAGLPAETCRKAHWLLSRPRRAVHNPPPSTTVPSPREEPPR